MRASLSRRDAQDVSARPLEVDGQRAGDDAGRSGRRQFDVADSPLVGIRVVEDDPVSAVREARSILWNNHVSRPQRQDARDVRRRDRSQRDGAGVASQYPPSAVWP